MPRSSQITENVAYYGRLSWGNFFDWLTTLCLCALFILAGTSLGSVRPETHLLLLPGFVLLLLLHGLWYAFEEGPVRLSRIPLLFLPFLSWAAFSIWKLSPMAWRGWQDMIYFLEAFIFLWVLCNNCRMMSHLWVVCLSAIIPLGYGVLIGTYQLFQNPEKVADALVEVPVQLSPEFMGRSTGVFADPHSFALLLLMLLPCFLFAGLAGRLPRLLRLLCLYVSLILLSCMVITQVFWAYFALAVVLFVVPWFAFKGLVKRFLSGAGLVLVLSLLFGIILAFSPYGREMATAAWTVEGEGVRRVLWPEAVQLVMERPVFGGGGGSFTMLLEQSPDLTLPRSAETPLNDALHLAVEYGLAGLLLLAVPVAVLLLRAYLRLRAEPFQKYSARSRKRKVMPSQRFFVSLALLGSFAFLLGSLLHGILLLPALLLHGTLVMGILIKMSFNRGLALPRHWLVRTAYALISFAAGLILLDLSLPVLRAREAGLLCSQRLEEIVERRIHLSGNPIILNDVIEGYANACLLDPGNADFWIGRSQAIAQRFFASPSLFREIGAESVACAQRAVTISPEYGRAWSQLGVAHALAGDVEAAEQALLRGVELAPNSSNAHYYWASFASGFEDKIEAAKRSAERAVAIDPDNAAAARIYQKLSIL